MLRASRGLMVLRQMETGDFSLIHRPTRPAVPAPLPIGSSAPSHSASGPAGGRSLSRRCSGNSPSHPQVNRGLRDLGLVCLGAAPLAAWPHTENQATVSVVAPLVVTVGTGKVPVVAWIAPVSPTSGAGRVSIAVEQPVCVCLQTPLVLAVGANEVAAHRVTVGAPAAKKRPTVVDASYRRSPPGLVVRAPATFGSVVELGRRPPVTHVRQPFAFGH